MNRFELHLARDAYPSRVREGVDPPPTIYGIGEASLLDTPTLGVIGARKATPYGLKAARMLAGWAAAEGYTIISGAAIGCDQAAHQAALEEGGRTVAVLGCGCDVDYPAGAHELLQVLRLEHAVVSERPWEAPPARWAFRQRNRLIAALSDSLLIVEAALPSGTFSTVDFAVDGQTDVLAVPGSVFSPTSRGCNRLIAQGATIITDVSDLAAALGHMRIQTEHSILERSTDTSARILAALLADPMRPDDVAYELTLDILTVSRALSELEREGALVRYRDGRYGPG
ncbi:MAG: DNA-processing protein DprA [Coriobacteriia bacterium]|nr:DNA-processing protein DprA [Coriobacteriia bacterium]